MERNKIQIEQSRCCFMVLKFERFFSPAGENRGIHLYLPDNYYESQERYPVLYMFDGHNLFFDGDATFGKCLGLKDFLDHWGKKMIVVGLACAADDIQRVHEYRYPSHYDLHIKMFHSTE
ncbi:MAG: alpha/beta hydrolase-fold protein [Clostridiales bacterium]|nr:alpha/beta hydrolase-fold protein [Clostridiales bacterium]